MAAGSGRLTRVVEVRECPNTPGTCCAAKRGSGQAKRGEFEAKCAEKRLKVLVGGREPKRKESPAPPAQGTGGLHMGRKRRRALAEYGEPFGDVGGFFSDLLDKRDWIDYGKIAAGSLVTAAAVPKLVALLDKVQFIPADWRPYVKGGVSVLSGFAAYKYGTRRVPARYRDMVVASAAVMAGLGFATIGHQVFDQGSLGGRLKELHGIGDLFPISLSNIGASEDAILAALNAVEDQAISADMDPSFGDVFTADSFDASVTPEELAADVDPEWSWTQHQLDASVEPEDVFTYGEDFDLAATAMVGL